VISVPLLGKGEEERPPAKDDGLLTKVPAGPRWLAASGRRRRRRRWFLDGSRPEPVPSHVGPLEPPKKDKLGICCSGGGIRSAAFSLGALQALQQQKKLEEAAYLAAVSGGSYIAAALSMVAKTGPGDSNAELLHDKPPFAPNSPEEQYLRNRSSYMAPTLADKVYLGWRVLLGLLFNLAFIALPLLGAALIVTGLLYAKVFPDLGGQCTAATCAANPPVWTWAVPLGVLLLSGISGLATLVFRWGGDRRQRFFTIWSVRLLVCAAVLALILVGLPSLIDWFDHLGQGGSSVKPTLLDSLSSIGAGFAALLAGVIAQIAHLLRSKEAAENLGKAQQAAGKLGSGVRLTLAYAAGALFGPLVLLLLVAIVVAVGMSQAGSDGGFEWGVAAVGAATLVAFGVLYRWADLSTWSLHPYYKRRLSSAFALKRVKEEDLTAEERERVEALADPGSGDDDSESEYEGLAIERDFGELVSLSDTALDEEKDRKWPTLLVCAAANVSDPGATPPGRQVTSFTFSAHAVGGPLVGAVGTKEMEGAFADRRRQRDLTLPAAVAMSGAAVSPSMGKATKRPLTFLMALANLRLGVWVPNPRWVAAGLDDDHGLEQHRYGRPRPWYLLCELLGRNRIDARYLYVTDGGHYENLGLVELLRRGCTKIYCLDASGVGQGRAEFDALGDAIALARSELGVEIDFKTDDPGDLEPDPDTHLAKKDVVTGTIRYTHGPEVVEGTLIYVRNAMTDRATWDARAHQLEDPRFPHNSTVDQLYTDKKFESYRVLGARAAGRAMKAMKAA
jgi:hypothetical protein